MERQRQQGIETIYTTPPTATKTATITPTRPTNQTGTSMGRITTKTGVTTAVVAVVAGARDVSRLEP